MSKASDVVTRLRRLQLRIKNKDIKETEDTSQED